MQESREGDKVRQIEEHENVGRVERLVRMMTERFIDGAMDR